MEKRYNWIMAGGLLAVLLGSSGALGQVCPGAHCSAKAGKINEVCKRQGKEGEPVWVENGADFCYCTCSCLAGSTPVQISVGEQKALGDIVVGETILAYNLSGQWAPASVDFSEGTETPAEPLPYVILLTLENGTAFVATGDHLFVGETGSLLRADRLAPGNRLRRAEGGGIAVVDVVHGSYQGPIHHIAINWGAADVEKHIINTNGVLSADYYVQARQDEYNLAALGERPQVGSEEYKRAYPKPQAVARDVGGSGTIVVGADTFFTPYREVTYPKDAAHLLPDGYYEEDLSFMEPLDNTVPYAIAKSLTSYYRVHYPEVEFGIDWGNNEVNAVAFRQGGRRHVVLYGGLLRHKHMRVEGVGLVLAHELGHHFGGHPRYTNNSWASCEGQSDYWGAAVAQRSVWFGPTYIEQTKAGAEQLRKLFSRAPLVEFLREHSSEVGGLCSHPPAQCRFDTYLAAVRLEDKPPCAGDASEFAFPPRVR